MTSDITKSDAAQRIDEGSEGLFDSWLDPIETALRERVRGFIETLIRDELEGVLARPRYGRRPKDADAEAGAAGHRHGSRSRTLTGTFGSSEITVPRARLRAPDGGTREWKSLSLPKIISAHSGDAIRTGREWLRLLHIAALLGLAEHPSRAPSEFAPGCNKRRTGRAHAAGVRHPAPLSHSLNPAAIG
jgi:hypothetical protein